MTIDKKTALLLVQPAKRWAWIVYQLKSNGSSLSEIARGAGVRKETLSKAAKTAYPRMEKLLADALELSPQQLFPDRYDRDGLPNRRVGRPRNDANKRVQKGRTRRNTSYRAAA